MEMMGGSCGIALRSLVFYINANDRACTRPPGKRLSLIVLHGMPAAHLVSSSGDGRAWESMPGALSFSLSDLEGGDGSLH